jgi:hypothetical protein
MLPLRGEGATLLPYPFLVRSDKEWLIKMRMRSANRRLLRPKRKTMPKRWVNDLHM